MRKKNKFAALLLASLMAFGLLAGCGSSAGDDGAAVTQPESGADKNGAAEDGQEQQEEQPGDAQGQQGGDGAAEVDPISLTLTTAYSETEMAGQVISHFIEYLNQKSNGAVQIEVYWGGTLASNTEELNFAGTGAADMTVVNQSAYTDVLSLMNFPSQVSGGYQAAVDFMDNIIFENEATAPLIRAQIEAQNVKMLGSVATGSNTFVSKEEAGSLADLTGRKLGVGMNQSAFEALGFSGVVTVMPWDYYDNLSRGIADVGYMSASALVSMSVQEVTPYFLMDGTYVAGNFMTINLDKWNSMSDAQKALFEEAMEDTAAYSVELAQQLDEDAEAIIEAAGGKVSILSKEDTKAVQEALFNTSVTDCRSFAQAAGCGEDMETVLSAVSEYLGIEME